MSCCTRIENADQIPASAPSGTSVCIRPTLWDASYMMEDKERGAAVELSAWLGR